jgi:hypothetical protein
METAVGQLGRTHRLMAIRDTGGGLRTQSAPRQPVPKSLMSQAGAKCLSNGIAFDVGLATGSFTKGERHEKSTHAD